MEGLNMTTIQQIWSTTLKQVQDSCFTTEEIAKYARIERAINGIRMTIQNHVENNNDSKIQIGVWVLAQMMKQHGFTDTEIAKVLLSE